MKTRMVSFRVDKNQHFFEIFEEDQIIYTSDMYDELEECIYLGTHMLDLFHEENPLREVEVLPKITPRNFSPSKKLQETF